MTQTPETITNGKCFRYDAGDVVIINGREIYIVSEISSETRIVLLPCPWYKRLWYKICDISAKFYLWWRL